MAANQSVCLGPFSSLGDPFKSIYAPTQTRNDCLCCLQSFLCLPNLLLRLYVRSLFALALYLHLKYKRSVCRSICFHCELENVWWAIWHHITSSLDYNMTTVYCLATYPFYHNNLSKHIMCKNAKYTKCMCVCVSVKVTMVLLGHA